MSRPRSPYLALETRIAADERGGIMHRWEYGRRLLDAKAGRKQLPHGMLADLIKTADRAGLKISETEIQRRVRLATVYGSEAEVRQAMTDFGSWTEIIKAGFPAVVVDDAAQLEIDDLSTAAPDEYEQLSLIPGLAPVLSVHGRKVPLAEATVADVEAYRDMYRQIHENYGKRLELIDMALDAMREGSGGDDQANALEAWKAALA